MKRVVLCLLFAICGVSASLGGNPSRIARSFIDAGKGAMREGEGINMGGSISATRENLAKKGFVLASRNGDVRDAFVLKDSYGISDVAFPFAGEEFDSLIVHYTTKANMREYSASGAVYKIEFKKVIRNDYSLSRSEFIKRNNANYDIYERLLSLYKTKYSMEYKVTQALESVWRYRDGDMCVDIYKTLTFKEKDYVVIEYTDYGWIDERKAGAIDEI